MLNHCMPRLNHAITGSRLRDAFVPFVSAYTGTDLKTVCHRSEAKRHDISRPEKGSVLFSREARRSEAGTGQSFFLAFYDDANRKTRETETIKSYGLWATRGTVYGTTLMGTEAG